MIVSFACEDVMFAYNVSLALANVEMLKKNDPVAIKKEMNTKDKFFMRLNFYVSITNVNNKKL